MNLLAAAAGLILLTGPAASGALPAADGPRTESLQEDPEQYALWEVTRWGRSRLVFTRFSGWKGSIRGSEIRGVVDVPMFRARFTKSSREGREQARFFLDSRRLAGSIRVFAGDYIPDIACGLIFSAYSFSYPFTSGYPVRRPRMIASGTACFGRSIRGGAVSCTAGGRAGLILFTGKNGRWTSRGWVYDGGSSEGLRIALQLRRLKLGLTAWRPDASERSGIFGFDSEYSRGDLVIVSETAFSPGGRLSVCCAARSGRASARTGLLLFSVPGLSRLSFGEFAPSAGKSEKGRRGFSVFGMRRLSRRLRLGFSHQIYRTAAGPDLDTRSVTRIESSARWKRQEARLSCSFRKEARLDMIPWPSSADESAERSAGIKLRYSLRGRSAVRIRITLEFERGDGTSGAALSPFMVWSSGERRYEVSVAFCTYRSYSGRAAFYIYEPQLEGAYPIVSAWGSGIRRMLLVRARVSGLTASGRLSAAPGMPGRLDFQLSYGF